MFFIVTAHIEHIAGLLADLCSRVIPLLTIYHCSTDSPINDDFLKFEKNQKHFKYYMNLI